MKVALRKRNQGGKTSLYLDYYHNGKRKTESLKLYLEPKPKNKAERDTNKKTLQLAESIRAKRQLEFQNNTFGFFDKEKLDASFLDYVQKLTDERFDSKGNHGNWDSMLNHLKAYTKTDKTFHQVTPEFVLGFKNYLNKVARTKSNKPLAQNTKHSYFNKFSAAIKQAVKDGILLKNPMVGIESIKQGEPEREFLTLEELQAAAKAECEIPIIKTAFLFSCLTGLRWSDINKLKWSEVQHSESMGYYIRFKQKKTKGVETLPISDQAYSMLGERGNKDEKVFRGLHYSSWQNLKLQQWMMRAGISKQISFHCARHTYATLQLSAGTDIYTVSKLLGHRELRTTQIYAKIIDDKKKEAANKIQIDL